jgi:hypothetical protein
MTPSMSCSLRWTSCRCLSSSLWTRTARRAGQRVHTHLPITRRMEVGGGRMQLWRSSSPSSLPSPVLLSIYHEHFKTLLPFLLPILAFSPHITYQSPLSHAVLAASKRFMSCTSAFLVAGSLSAAQRRSWCLNSLGEDRRSALGRLVRSKFTCPRTSCRLRDSVCTSPSSISHKCSNSYLVPSTSRYPLAGGESRAKKEERIAQKNPLFLTT